jgi:signal transduction histidine kinase
MMFPLLGAIFAGPGLLLWVARGLRPLGRVASAASPAISLLGWGTLATFTLGLKSPILAAFFFEIGLAAVSMGPFGVAGVTGAAILVLTLVQTIFGLAAGWQLLLIESGFLAVVGGLGFAMAQRRVASEAALRIQSDELGQRLETLQRQLDDERVVARVGENVARLAHGLKNAVHSLRGFVGLIEPEVDRGGHSRQALAGLRAVIDDLERLARLTLTETLASGRNREGLHGSGGGLSDGGPSANANASTRPMNGLAAGNQTADLLDVVAAAVRDLRASNPDVVFDLRIAPGEPRDCRVSIAATPLHELLTILLRNAAEAMHGVGRCTIDVTRKADRCHVEIGDEGEGLTPDAAARLFSPGFTTKSGGSGFGLFLARRIVEDHEGSLELVPKPEKGAVAVLELPQVEVGGEARIRSDARSPGERKGRV